MKIKTQDYRIDKMIPSLGKKTMEIFLKNGDTTVKGILKNNIDLVTESFSENDHVICGYKERKRGEEIFLEIIYIKSYETGEQVKKENIDESKLSETHDKIIPLVAEQISLGKKPIEPSQGEWLEPYKLRLRELINTIKDKDYKSLLEDFFDVDGNILDMFYSSPASKDNHHNYEGGLLQHAIEVADRCLIDGEYYGANVDLLITAALLHDIGKIRSYDYNDKGVIFKTEWEELLGHLNISALFISKMLPADFDKDKILELYHLIFSHHGRKSNGCIDVKTKEALILNSCDSLSLGMNHIDSLTYTGGWSDIDNLFKHKWYKNPNLEK